MRSFLQLVALGGGIVLLSACGSPSGSKYAAPAAVSSRAPATLAATVVTTPTVAVATPAAPTATPAALTTGTPAARFQPPTPATNPVERLGGTVQTVNGNTVTLDGGKSFTLSPQTAITTRAQGTAASLQTGKVVAITAKPQSDGTLLASLVVVFATNGPPLGQRPLDAGNLMTNATIDKVQGNSFSATFPGGGVQVTLAPDTQVQVLGSGTPADIKPGAMIQAGVLNGVAQSVSVQ